MTAKELKYKNVSKMGIYNSGWKANSKGQTKKSESQMSTDEKEYLTYLIRDIRSFRINEHLKLKREKGLIKFDILSVSKSLRAPNVINLIKEYSENVGHDGTVDRRVLLGSNKREKVYIKGKGYQWCTLRFVLSLDKAEIITAYYIGKNRKFAEISESRYDENLDILNGGK